VGGGGVGEGSSRRDESSPAKSSPVLESSRVAFASRRVASSRVESSRVRVESSRVYIGASVAQPSRVQPSPATSSQRAAGRRGARLELLQAAVAERVDGGVGSDRDEAREVTRIRRERARRLEGRGLVVLPTGRTQPRVASLGLRPHHHDPTSHLERVEAPRMLLRTARTRHVHAVSRPHSNTAADCTAADCTAAGCTAAVHTVSRLHSSRP
jgi:hypothetical protein